MQRSAARSASKLAREVASKTVRRRSLSRFNFKEFSAFADYNRARSQTNNPLRGHSLKLLSHLTRNDLVAVLWI